MLDWEQISVGMQLHGYKDHGQLPVCGLEAARRRATDPYSVMDTSRSVSVRTTPKT